jgi:ATP-dependent exoDNAse (exonuclease V) alpha subunit
VLESQQPQEGAGVDIKHVTYDDIGDIVLTADSDTQIISPYNSLNSQINQFLRKGDEAFNVGDKVMTVRNTRYYCNGDIGIITNIDEKGTLVVNIDGKNVSITKAHTEDIVLAYAVTVHKMQGSEAPRIMFFVPENDSLISNRLMYTAFTRAKSKLEVYYYTNNEETL